MLKSKIVQKWIVALPSSMHCIFLCPSRVLKVESENSWHWCACLDFRAFWLLLHRDGFPRKNAFVWILSKLPPAPPLFSDVEIQDLKVSLWLQILYILYIIQFTQPKNSSGSNYWHFGRNRLLYWPKMYLLKMWQKIWAGPSSSSPSFGQNPKQQFFFGRTSLCVTFLKSNV